MRPAAPTVGGGLADEASVADRVAALALVTGLLAMYAPVVFDWFRGRWDAELQGHEMLIVGVCAWLITRRVPALAQRASPPAPAAAWAVAVGALLFYVFGRTQDSLRAVMISLPLLVAALLMHWRGTAALRAVWFPMFFFGFAIPLPYTAVLVLTGPLKAAVSVVATQLLDAIGYPVGRSGVVITVGQYQLLVTEACAGLQTMFTVEAMGLLYASLMNHVSWARNAALALLVVPVAFAANVVRVVVLALITFHWGDAAGQGFLHGAAGLMLFGVALAGMFGIDALLGLWFERRRQEAA